LLNGFKPHDHGRLTQSQSMSPWNLFSPRPSQFSCE